MRYAGMMLTEGEHTKQITLCSKLAFNTYVHEINVDIDRTDLLIDALKYPTLIYFIYYVYFRFFIILPHYFVFDKEYIWQSNEVH